VLYREGFRPCHAAFEGLSGDLLVAWGFSRFAEETRWGTLERASGTWRFRPAPEHGRLSARTSSWPPIATRDMVAAILSEADLDGDVSVSNLGR
jgi:hypothetical protein